LIDDETYHAIMTEVIETIVLFSGEKEFYGLISKSYRELLVNVSLTLLRTTKSEFDMMTKDPESFVNLALDTCDK